MTSVRLAVSKAAKAKSAGIVARRHVLGGGAGTITQVEEARRRSTAARIREAWWRGWQAYVAAMTTSPNYLAGPTPWTEGERRAVVRGGLAR
jgi:hypothetical protein